MKKLLKLLLINIVFVNLAYSNQFNVRIKNPLNQTQTFVYNITYIGDSAHVTRTSEPSLSSDNSNFYIFGNGWNYNSGSKELTLPNNNNLNWIAVDGEFTGLNSVINSPTTITIKCPCDNMDNVGECKSIISNNCIECRPESPCLFCKSPEVVVSTPSKSAYFPLILNVSKVSFEVIGATKTYVFRRVNPLNVNMSYVYNIKMLADSTVEVLRTNDIVSEIDVTGTLIFAHDNFSYNYYNGTLNLVNMLNFNWYRLDTSSTGGDIAIINNGSVDVTCDCKKKEKNSTSGTCSPATMISGKKACVQCVVDNGCEECNDPVFSETNGNSYSAGIYICAKSHICPR